MTITQFAPRNAEEWIDKFDPQKRTLTGDPYLIAKRIMDITCLASVAAELAAIEPLAGRYEVTRLRVASPKVWVRRDKGGEFVLAPLFRAPTPTSAATPAPAPEKPLTYRLDEFDVEGGRVHWLDERGSRPIELELRDLRSAVRSISSAPGSRLTFEVAATTDLQESLALGGEAALQPIEVSGKVRIEKLSLPRLWPLAEPLLAAELTSGRLDAVPRFNYQGKDAAAPHLVLEGIEATAAAIAMRLPRAKQDFLRLATFELRDGSSDLVAERVALGDIASRGMRLNAVRERDGSIDLVGTLFGAMAGPIYAVYLDQLKLGKDAFRATVAAMLFCLGLARGTGYLAIGAYDRDVMIAFAVALPMMLIGVALGNFIHTNLNPTAFRRLVAAVLMASGIPLLFR